MKCLPRRRAQESVDTGHPVRLGCSVGQEAGEKGEALTPGQEAGRYGQQEKAFHHGASDKMVFGKTPLTPLMGRSSLARPGGRKPNQKPA